MILPSYVYMGDWRENKSHLAAIEALSLRSDLRLEPVDSSVTFFEVDRAAELAARPKAPSCAASPMA
jgi:hypothetical protein